MADLTKLIDELSKLTVLEAAELVKALEEKWGVSAAAPVAVAAAGPAAAACHACHPAGGLICPGFQTGPHPGRTCSPGGCSHQSQIRGKRGPGCVILSPATLVA